MSAAATCITARHLGMRFPLAGREPVGLEQQSAGELRIETADPAKPLTALVFQEQSIFPWMTVEANVGYGLRMRGVHASIRRRVVAHYLDKVGLARFAKA